MPTEHYAIYSLTGKNVKDILNLQSWERNVFFFIASKKFNQGSTANVFKE